MGALSANHPSKNMRQTRAGFHRVQVPFLQEIDLLVKALSIQSTKNTILPGSIWTEPMSLRRKFGLIAACAVQQCLLDYLVSGGEQRGRNGEVERLGGLEVEDELEFGRLPHRKTARLLAAKNAIDSAVTRRAFVATRTPL
jgi:hypothetical protein